MMMLAMPNALIARSLHLSPNFPSLSTILSIKGNDIFKKRKKEKINRGVPVNDLISIGLGKEIKM